MDVSAIADKALPAVLGVSGGGLTAIWFAKLMFQRLLKQYDAGISKLTEAVNDLKIKIAVLEVTLADAKTLRSDVKEIAGKCEVIRDRCDKLQADMNVAHARIRDIKSSVKTGSGIEPLT